MRVGVGKQWHVGYEAPAVIADNFLHDGEKGKREDMKKLFES